MRQRLNVGRSPQFLRGTKLDVAKFTAWNASLLPLTPPRRWTDEDDRGHAYVAPADHHLLVIDNHIRLGRGPRENLAHPAIDPLFRSVGISFGPRAIAAVVTGMLNDGSAGLADVKRCGGITVVQSPTDALAPEMPWGALSASDIDYRAPLSGMASLLVHLSGEKLGPEVDIPPGIKTEVQIALGGRADATVMAQFADPIALVPGLWRRIVRD